MHDSDLEPVWQLPRIDHTLLWAMRVWVLGQRTNQQVTPQIDAVFRHVGVRNAAPVLASFLHVLSHGLRRTVEINCTCRTSYGPDERLLLDTFGLLSLDRHEDAEALLRSIADERAALVALDCALRLVLLFQEAGHLRPVYDRFVGQTQPERSPDSWTPDSWAQDSWATCTAPRVVH